MERWRKLTLGPFDSGVFSGFFTWILPSWLSSFFGLVYFLQVHGGHGPRMAQSVGGHPHPLPPGQARHQVAARPPGHHRAAARRLAQPGLQRASPQHHRPAPRHLGALGEISRPPHGSRAHSLRRPGRIVWDDTPFQPVHRRRQPMAPVCRVPHCGRPDPTESPTDGAQVAGHGQEQARNGWISVGNLRAGTSECDWLIVWLTDEIIMDWLIDCFYQRIGHQLWFQKS